MSLSKTERLIVGTGLAIICPLLAFVACWWTAAAVELRGPSVSEGPIKIAAMLGLAMGIALDLVFLKHWIAAFYSANLKLMAALYGVLCPVAVAMFMGLPLGTLSLGILAGIYAGRRAHHARSEAGVARRSFVNTALFAATLTAGAALPIGLLVLREQSIVELLGGLSGMNAAQVQGAAGIAVIVVLSLVLFAIQYGLSVQAAKMAFRIGAADGAQRSS